MNKYGQARSDEDRSGEAEETGPDRRQLFLLLSAAAGVGAMPAPAGAEGAIAIAPPRRALTGRDASGKSVFQSGDRVSWSLEGIIGLKDIRASALAGPLVILAFQRRPASGRQSHDAVPGGCPTARFAVGHVISSVPSVC